MNMLRRFSRLFIGVLAGGFVLAAHFAPAMAQDEDDYRFELDFGYRWKSGFKGSEDLYRTQVDLDEGLRLFSGSLYFAPAEGRDSFFDRLEMNFNGLGGEPIQTARVRLSKNGLYEFNFFFQNFDYFSSIPSLANPKFEKGDLLSQHTQDTTLRTGGFDLVFAPGKRVSPFFSYQRSSRSGPVRTTARAEGDEFVLNSDLDVHADDIRGGLLFTFAKASVRVEQGGRWFNDETSFYGVAQEGNLPGTLLRREIYLDGYKGDTNSYSRVIPYSSVNAIFTPAKELVLRGKATYSMADTRTNFYDSMQGNFFSYPALKAFYAGLDQTSSGSTRSPNLLLDGSAEWSPTEWLVVTERFRTHRMHVSGLTLSRLAYSDVDPLLGLNMISRVETAIPYSYFMGLNVNIQELEGEVFLRPELSLRLGHRFERQEYESAQNYGFDRHILIVGATYRQSAKNRFDVDYEYGDTDRPITRTTPLDFKRLRLRGQMSPFESLQVRGSATLFDHDNSALDFFSENRTYGLAFTYTPIDRVSVSGQWDRTQIDTEIPYVIPQTFELDTFSFSELGDYGNVYVSLQLIKNAQVSLGYSVWDNTGTLPIKYHQPFAKLEIPLGERLVAYGKWNGYDYSERVELLPQEYRTQLAVLGLRLAIDK